MKRKAIRLLIWVLVLICIVPAAAMARTYVVRWQAKNFLQDVVHLRVGESDFAELQRLANKYRSYAVQGSPRCDQDLCTFDFYFGNRWLWQIGLAPGARFGSAITAQKGKITEIEVFLQTGIAYTVDVVESPATPGSIPFKLAGGKRATSDVDLTMTIHLTSAASEQERQKAYNFNLACLTALRGCNDARQMLPGAW